MVRMSISSSKFRYIVFLTAFLSFNANSQWNVFPATTIKINISYDQFSNEIYDVSLSGSNTVSATVLSNGEIKIIHGRDGLDGKTVESAAGGSWEAVRYERNEARETKRLILTEPSSGKNFTVMTTLGTTKIFSEYAFGDLFQHDYSTGCRSVAGYGIVDYVTTSNAIDYQAVSSCGSRVKSVAANRMGDPSGSIERYFKFNLNEIKKLPFGTYTGSYLADTVDALIAYDRPNSRGSEIYQYIVTFDMKPNIVSFEVDESNLLFDVNKTRNRITGIARTGFTARGAFKNSQNFQVTLSSQHSGQCSGISKLCLYSPTTSTSHEQTIPYIAKILDPATLHYKMIINNGQSVDIYSDKDYQLSSEILLEFDMENNGTLKGDFTDLLTVKIQLVI